jgi:hypothetical protein
MLHQLHILLTHPLFWVVAAVGGFLLLLFVTSVMERQHTYAYVPVRVAGESLAPARPGTAAPVLPYSDRTPDASMLPEYVRVMSDDALAAGFAFDRMAAHPKLPRVQVVATVWSSFDRRMILITGAGKVFGMAARQTWLYTPLKDGRVLVTTDDNDAGDQSGVYVIRRVLRARLDQLLESHRERMEEFGAQVGAFTEPTAFEALLALYARRTQRLVELGRARYADAGHLYWHYTASGAWRICAGFFTQLFQAIPQAARVNRSPVGSHVPQPLGQSVYERYRRAEQR